MTAAIIMRTTMWNPRSLYLSELQDTKNMIANAQAYGGTVIRLDLVAVLYPRPECVNKILFKFA